MSKEDELGTWRQLILPDYAALLRQQVELPAPDMPSEQEIFGASGVELQVLLSAVVRRTAAKLWIKSGVLARDEIELSSYSAGLVNSWRDNEPCVLKVEEIPFYSMGMFLDDEGQAVVFVFFYNNKVGRKKPTSFIACVVDEEGGVVERYGFKYTLFHGGHKRQFYRKKFGEGHTLFGEDKTGIDLADNIDILITHARMMRSKRKGFSFG